MSREGAKGIICYYEEEECFIHLLYSTLFLFVSMMCPCIIIKIGDGSDAVSKQIYFLFLILICFCYNRISEK